MHANWRCDYTYNGRIADVYIVQELLQNVTIPSYLIPCIVAELWHVVYEVLLWRLLVTMEMYVCATIKYV